MSPNDVLSQDEIDALLHGVDSGAVNTEPEAAPGEERPYDFANQVRIVRRPRPQLKCLNGRVGRAIRGSLCKRLRRGPEVADAAIKSLKFSAFVQGPAYPPGLNLVRILPLRGTALVVLDPKLVF